MTSPLLDTHIDRYYYNRILGIYNTSVRHSITESTRKSYKEKIIIYLLKVINHILDVEDEFQSTRALAINEILQNNYESFGEDVDELDNMDDLDSPQIWPSPPSLTPPSLQLPPRQNSIFNLPPIIGRSMNRNQTISSGTQTDPENEGETEEELTRPPPPPPRNIPRIPLRPPSPIELQSSNSESNQSMEDID